MQGCDKLYDESGLETDLNISTMITYHCTILMDVIDQAELYKPHCRNACQYTDSLKPSCTLMHNQHRCVISD
jgi:hypothetical protein